MTVEIRELIIKATVSKKQEDDSDIAKPENNYDKDELISTCVDQVLKILERSKER